MAVFGDALRRLSTAATYLYHDGARYWYSTQPTVTKMAEDRAEQLTRNPDKVVQELDKRVRADVRKVGDFPRVHALPQSGQDVPDDMDARLVVLGVDHPYTKEPGNAAEAAAKTIFESRGNAPRLFSNTLVFLALDKVRLQDLDDAIRTSLNPSLRSPTLQGQSDMETVSVAVGAGTDIAADAGAVAGAAAVRPGGAGGAGKQEASQ